jgi:hypothetical protein
MNNDGSGQTGNGSEFELYVGSEREDLVASSVTCGQGLLLLELL